jgi:cytochrome c oxidase subunit 2
MVSSMTNPISPDALFSGLTLAQSSLEETIFRNTGRTALANRVDSDFMFILWVSVASFVILMFLMTYWVIKYRRRPGVAPMRSPSHNTVLEITWTVVPTIFLAIMFFRGFWVYIGQVVIPGDNIELTVKAQKWNWAATYPGGVESLETARIGAVDVPIWYVPSETPIKIRQSSTDVMHAFYVPDFRVKFDVFPNRYTQIWFKTEPPTGKTVFKDGLLAGEAYEDHWVFCAEYCGENHSEMAAIIRTVSPNAYAKWYQRQVEGDPNMPLPQMGQKLYAVKCASCHSVDGSANTGPSWKGIFGQTHEMSDGAKVTVDENYIRESILVPSAKIVKGFPNQMPSFQGQVNDKQLEALIAYIKSLAAEAAPAK